MLYSVYRIINKINDKEYIGFHKVQEGEFQPYSESGSIYNDGYMGSGKLIGRALAKYGPENFSMELLFLSANKQEAQDYEAKLVNESYIKREDTYNVVVGGNVISLSGEKNGFFGKHHTIEVTQQIVRNRRKTYETNPYKFGMCTVIGTGKILLDQQEIRDHFNLPNDKFMIYKLAYDGVIRFYSNFLQDKAIEAYIEREEWIKSAPARREKNSRETSKRFLGKKRSAETCAKISAGIKKWINENPEKHNQKMEKINKNPEKIRKTADKHRGSKRSAETCAKISVALRAANIEVHNKGTILCTNEQTGKRAYYLKENIPVGWKRGRGPIPDNRKGKWYNKDGKIIKILNGETPPAGYVPGRGPRR